MSPASDGTGRKLVFASSNAGKLRELRALLAHSSWEVRTLSELIGYQPAIEETADTFAANAVIKAHAAAGLSGLLSLADDSGLEVDALGGQPGVRSRRFAHEAANDEENNAALLEALRDVPEALRTARFRCVLAVCAPSVRSPCITVQGTCEGRIALAPRPGHGFGYDPVFLVSELGGRFMSELTTEQKNAISHRGRAMRALVDRLQELDWCQGTPNNS